VHCGAVLSTSAKFCSECGRAAGVPPEPETRFASPEAYTPKHLAEKILTSKSALEGERKQVTVLFADLKGSMELLADRDAEEARKLLDPVLERMMEAVHRYEGTVNQVMGDGIMALFGAPLAHEDHAVRACYAALRMQECVKRYADEVRRSHAAVVKIRVGLNSGEVVVRAVGNDLRMDYTAVGQTTHLAARMEQIADPGAIVITPDTLALAEGYVEVKPLGPVPVKGLAQPVEVYEVTGAGPARTRLQAAAWRGLTRFVGRDAELAQLRHAQELAGDGHGQVAAVVGEAGVGKSRLVYEFTHSHRLQGWLVLESASVSYGKATSYLPIIDLLKGYFKIQDRDDLREIREKVTGKLLTLDEALKPTLPALLALLDMPVDDAAWQTLDPAARRRRTLDAVKRLLLREAREQPLLLIFEDLHWIDGETQALLDGLVDSLGSARLLLLVNYRPEYQHAWGGKTSYSQMRLDALPAESAGELQEVLLGADPGLAPLKQRLVKRGNPFFLEESVRTLVETKALTGERGRYRLIQPVQTIQVPPTVQAMLAARIDRLSTEDKRLLQVASVVGKDVSWPLLQAIDNLADDALRGGLDRLQAAEFVYETGLYPDLEYSFKHALTHEVTYGGLLHDRRRELHARIVGAIEALYRDRIGEQIERLAHHALRGELGEKAVHYLRQAGLRAAARSAPQEALARFDQALGVLEVLPEGPSTLEQAFDIRLDLRPVLNNLGEARRALERMREAETVAERLNDDRGRGRVSALVTNIHSLLGEPDEGLVTGTRALAIAGRLGDVRLRIHRHGGRCRPRGGWSHHEYRPAGWKRHRARVPQRGSPGQVDGAPERDPSQDLARRGPLASGDRAGPGESVGDRGRVAGPARSRAESATIRRPRGRVCRGATASRRRPHRLGIAVLLCPPDPPRRTGGQASAADDVPSAGVCRRLRWTHVLWAESPRAVPTRGHLRGQDPQGSQARRPTRRATHEVRAGHQPQDREGPRPHDPARGARAGGRNHSVTPPSWLDATGRRRPTRACWTCGREVAVMRMRAEHLRPHGWLPGRTLHIPAWCGCTTEYVPVPVRSGWWQLVPILELDQVANPLRRFAPPEAR
jgi:class 3 adenylate cyclase